ncbi:MAG: DNA-binding protein [Oleiphilus sp.]|nr:MAG: DNA-binding protein [Oleiphilus sp.]
MKITIFLLTTLLTFTTALFAQQSLADAPDATANVSVDSGKVNINTADAKTLAGILKGVGLKKAEAIIHYRKTYGPFHDIQELAEVSGIGKSTVEKNAGLIAVK